MFHQLMIWLFTPIMELRMFSPLLDAMLMPANMIWMTGLTLIYGYEHWMKYYYHGQIFRTVKKQKNGTDSQ